MKSSMFDRYGGFGVVHKVVLSFYDKMLDSDVVGPYFDDVEMPKLVDHQTKFISQVMGGPEAYTNEVLQRVHAKLNIDAAAFEEMATILEETLEDFELDPKDIAHIVGDVRSRADYIITA